MARPTKLGLDYFPLDTSLDSKLELFEAEYGLEGFAFIIKLFQKIYDNGYFCEWNEDEQLLFSKRINVNIETVNVYINSALKRKIFNQELFEKYNILTSRGIQKRFLEACKRRKQIEFIKEFCLVNLEETQYQDFKNKVVYVSNNPVNVDINLQNVDINSQSKVNKSKVNESKVKEEENIIYDADVEKIQTILIETIGTMNLTVIQEAISYLEDLPIALIEYALKKTARKGAKWDYAQSILNEYIRKNIKTVAEAQTDDLAFKNSRVRKPPDEETDEEKNARIIREMEATVNGNSGIC